METGAGGGALCPVSADGDHARLAATRTSYGQLSRARPRKVDPAPGRFELSEVVSKGKSAVVLGFETLYLKLGFQN